MNETEKLLTDAYYRLSMYKAGAITEGVAMEKVKKAIFAQPQLNESQQIVLEKLKRLLVDYDVYNANPFETIYCFVDDYGTEKYYENLTAKQEVQVLQVFIQWALEQEE